MNPPVRGALPRDAPVTNGSGAVGPAPSRPPAVAPFPGQARWATRSERIGLLSISLGAAGLGGAWESATATVSAPIGVSDALFTVGGLVWLVLLIAYIRHGGGRWRNLRHDIRHPAQGFALAYVPIAGMLFAGHFARFGLEIARATYVVFAAAAAVLAARLLSHWFTGTLSSSLLHPGYLLPVSSGPFIASTIASTLQWPGLAAATFAVGLVYWLAFGTVILGGLVASPGLPQRARPTLTVLIIPPATGGLAWIAAHRGVVDAVGCGFAGLLAFTVLIVACLLPDLRQQSFHTGYWTFSFPLAAGANFAIRWFHGMAVPAWRPMTWAVLGAATVPFVALGIVTIAHAFGCGARPGAHRRV